MTFAALVALFPSYAPQLDHATPPMSWPRLVMFYGGELGDERRVIARHEDVFSNPANPGPRMIGAAAIDLLRQLELPVRRPAGARSGVDG